MVQKKPSDKKVPPEAASSGNVEQIREILFGAQIREFQQQFDQLEERIGQEATSLHQDLQARVSSVEKYAQGEIDRLTRQLQQEREARLSANRELDERLGNLDQNLSADLDRLGENNNADSTRLRQELHDEISLLQAQLREQQESTLQTLDQHTARLQKDKLNQSDLADLFNEMGARMRGNSSPPNAEVAD